MKLLIQPDDGTMPMVKAITKAKDKIELTIFRFDQREIEQALARAISRGVHVHALIAHTNRAGTANLRELEMRLLAAGATVTRTADDLARYHGKLMIVDRREMYLLAFNLTHQDMERSRSFAVITASRSLVREAVKLFEADATRGTYEAGNSSLLISPVNARKQLAKFIQGARKQLLIYDPKVSDAAMIRLLENRVQAGVDVRILGKVAGAKFDNRKLAMRLHARTIVRDGSLAFIGSQSLRPMELDMRREIGVIFRDRNAVARIAKTFEDDWAAAGQSQERLAAGPPAPAEKVARKIAKALVKELPAVAPVVDNVVRELVGDTAVACLDVEDVEETVKEAVKEAVRSAVQDAVEEAVEQDQEQPV